MVSVLKTTGLPNLCAPSSRPSHTADTEGSIVQEQSRSHGHSLPCPGTCRELEAPVYSQMGGVTCRQFYIYLHPPRVRVEAISEGEPELIHCHTWTTRHVPNQPSQDILVGEGGALGQNPPILQRFRSSLPPEQMT